MFCPIIIFKSMFSLPIDKFRHDFSPLRGRYIDSIINHNILYSSLSLDILWCQNFSRYVAIPASDMHKIYYDFLNNSEQKDVFLSVKLVNNVNGYNKDWVLNFMSYNRANMWLSYIPSKNCPLILYFFCQKFVGTLITNKTAFISPYQILLSIFSIPSWGF